MITLIILIVLVFIVLGLLWVNKKPASSTSSPATNSKLSKTFWKWTAGIVGACVVGTLLYLYRKEVLAVIPSRETIWRYLSVEWMPWSAFVGGILLLVLVIKFFGRKALGEFILKAATACLILGGIWLIIDRMSGCAQRMPAPQQWGVASTSAPVSRPSVDRITVKGTTWTAIHRNNWAGVVMDVEPGKTVIGKVMKKNGEPIYFTIKHDEYQETSQISDDLKRGTWYFTSDGDYSTTITFTR